MDADGWEGAVEKSSSRGHDCRGVLCNFVGAFKAVGYIHSSGLALINFGFAHVVNQAETKPEENQWLEKEDSLKF